MSNAFILGIDQGTSGTRAFIFDAQGKVRASAHVAFPQYFPKPGWVEHDAGEIWGSVEKVVRAALNKGGINPKRIKAIGITNQRETTLVWDRKTGRPLHKAIVWQCRRTVNTCARLKKHQALFRRTTGLVVDAYFSATKIQWLLDHVPHLRAKARKGEVAFGTIDSWLIYQLTGKAVHATDMTNASRTMIFDIYKKAWSVPLLKLLNIPESILPKVYPSAHAYGVTAQGVAGLPAGIPICAVMGDQQAALYGQGCWVPGTFKNTYGTGCFILFNTGNKCVNSRRGLLTTLACDAQGKPVFALEGAVFIAGALVQWLRDGLKIIPSSAGTERIIAGLKNSNGVYVVPAFVGLGAPYWDGAARGIITGLTRGATRAHVVRASLEAMAYQTKDIVDVMRQESSLKINMLAVDGGACRNDFLMQFQSDMLATPVMRPRMIDSTVAGAAYLAGLTIGLWQKQDLKRFQSVDKVFYPRMSSSEIRHHYAGWQKAVRQTRAS